MAHSLKMAGSFAVAVLLCGCSMTPHTNAAAQKLNDVLATQQKATEAYQADDMEHASALYLKLTRLIPQEADYWYMLGNTYVRLQQPDQAVQAYQQAIARNPNHSRAWHNLGIVRMRQATAAFVSSASTAKTGDPMNEISTQLADQLARISSGGNKSSDEIPTEPLPFTAAERLDPLARMQHVRASKPAMTAAPVAGAVTAGDAAARAVSAGQQ